MRRGVTETTPSGGGVQTTSPSSDPWGLEPPWNPKIFSPDAWEKMNVGALCVSADFSKKKYNVATTQFLRQRCFFLTPLKIQKKTTNRRHARKPVVQMEGSRPFPPRSLNTLLAATATSLWGWKATVPAPKKMVRTVPGLSEEGLPGCLDLKAARPEAVTAEKLGTVGRLRKWSPRPH